MGHVVVLQGIVVRQKRIASLSVSVGMEKEVTVGAQTYPSVVRMLDFVTIRKLIVSHQSIHLEKV